MPDETVEPTNQSALVRLLTSPMFFLVGLITAATLILFALWLPQLPRQRAIRAIEASGGTVEWESDFPEWTGRAVLGFARVTTVNLDGTGVDDRITPHVALLTEAQTVWFNSDQLTDAGVARLMVFDGIRSLDLGDNPVTEAGVLPLIERQTALDTVWLQGTPVGDATLAALGRKSTLTFVTIGRTKITDDGLAHLGSLSHLSELDISETQISDQGLAHLAGAPALTELTLTGTKVTDDVFRHLATIPTLITVNMGNTQVTGARFADLAASSISALYLDGSPVGDEGLEHITDIKSLTTLSLTNTQITDAGLKRLHTATQLAELYVDGTGVTMNGIARLRRALPDVSITEDAPYEEFAPQHEVSGEDG